MNPPTFKCGVCGADTALEHDEGQPVCPDHCEDHDYRHESFEGWMCVHCGEPPPPDWYRFDPD